MAKWLFQHVKSMLRFDRNFDDRKTEVNFYEISKRD